jgi:hypothetical protein
MARPKKHHTGKYEESTVDNKTSTNNDDQASNPGSGTSLTPDQQAIFNRVQAETADWEVIREDQMNDFSLAVSPLDLRHNFPEAERAQKEKQYAFRWCERTDKRIDELTRGGHPVTRWKICTRSTTPFLAQYVDGVLGCIARLDQILLFRPWERHMMEQKAKGALTEAHVNSGKPENLALRRAGEKVEAYSGPEYKIDSRDVVQYEDMRSESEEVGDLVVE